MGGELLHKQSRAQLPLDREVLAVADEAARHPGSRLALFKPLFPILVMNCHRRWQRRLAR
jgi:hypothetical protein